MPLTLLSFWNALHDLTYMFSANRPGSFSAFAASCLSTHIYFPTISEAQYKHFAFDKVMNNYFENSYESLVSFLVNEKKMDMAQLDEIIALAEQLKNKK